MAALRAAELTPAQQEKMRQIMDSERNQSEAAIGRLHIIHEQISDKLLGTKAVSEAELASLAQQANEVNEQMQQQWLRTAIRIRSILTPDQLSRMNAFHHQVTAINAQIEALMQSPMRGMPGH
jgi:hypothetical protein